LKIATIAGLVPALFFGLFGLFASVFAKAWMFLVCFGSFALVVGIVFGVATYFGALKKAPNLDRPWKDVLVGPYREFAQRVSGTLEASQPMVFGLVPAMPKCVTFSDEGTKMRLEHQQEGSGDNARSYLRLAFDLPQPTSFRCHVYHQGVMSQLATAVGTLRDVQLGWELFDAQFIVTASSSEAARQVLTRQVQEILLRIKLWLRERERPEYVELIIEHGTAAVRLHDLLDNADDLITFYELGRNLYAELRKTLN
jgi:hypothetical protein